MTQVKAGKHQSLSEAKKLIVNAAQMMGWTILEKPTDFVDSPGTYFFFADDLTPIKAVAMGNSATPKRGGLRLMWERWNPQFEPAPLYEVVSHLSDQGWEVYFKIAKEDCGCSLYNPASGVSVAVQSNTACRAFCQALQEMNNDPLNEAEALEEHLEAAYSGIEDVDPGMSADDDNRYFNQEMSC